MWPIYPYMNINDLNLDWIINKIASLDKKMDTYTALNTISWGGAWDIGEAYKQWTIVEDSGDGYLSIQPVPRNVPISDTDYWVMVANYSALYAAFAQRITDLENDMLAAQNDITNLQGDMTTAQNNITTLQSDVTRLSNLEWKHDLSGLNILFIMDSYGSRTTTYSMSVDAAVNYLTGATTHLEYYPGGDLTVFKNLVENYSGDHDEINTIVLIGGANDQAKTEADIVTYMSQFVASCKTHYDNLNNIYILCPGITFSTLQSPALTVESRETLWNGYKRGAELNGAIYIDNSQYILRNTALLTSDYCHPTADGMDKIVEYTIEGLVHNAIDVHYRIETTFGSDTYTMTRDNAICTVTSPYGIPEMFKNAGPLDMTAVNWNTFGTLGDSLIDNAAGGGHNAMGYPIAYEASGVVYVAVTQCVISEKSVGGYSRRIDASSPGTGYNVRGMVSSSTIHN